MGGAEGDVGEVGRGEEGGVRGYGRNQRMHKGFAARNLTVAYPRWLK